MSANEDKNPISKRFKHLVSGDSFLSIVFGLSVLLVVAHFAGLGRGRVAALCAAIDIYVIRRRWEFIAKPWFWLALFLIALIQVPVIGFVSWGGESLPPYGLIPAGAVVYLVDEGLMFFLGGGSARSPK